MISSHNKKIYLFNHIPFLKFIYQECIIYLHVSWLHTDCTPEVIRMSPRSTDTRYGSRGWMRLANLNMSDPNQQVPKRMRNGYIPGRWIWQWLYLHHPTEYIYVVYTTVRYVVKYWKFCKTSKVIMLTLVLKHAVWLWFYIQIIILLVKYCDQFSIHYGAEIT